MKSSIATCLVLILGSTASTMAFAADGEASLERTEWQDQFRSAERTYFREHRLRAYERTRADVLQGATCVTPQGVCWIVEPLSHGDSCSCESRRSRTTAGTVGG
jgi:hypothetical protein